MNKFKRFEGHQTAGYNIGFDINSNGTMMVSGSSDGYAVFYNAQTSKIISKLSLFTKPLIQPCTDAKFNPYTQNKIAFSSWNGVIKIYETES